MIHQIIPIIHEYAFIDVKNLVSICSVNKDSRDIIYRCDNVNFYLLKEIRIYLENDCLWQDDDIDIIKHFMLLGININDIRILPDHNELKALCSASRGGELNMIEYLITLGINIVDDYDIFICSIIEASLYGQLKTIKYFVKKKIITLKDIRSNDNEALRWASNNGHLHIIKYFVKLGLTIEDVRSNNNEALQWACKGGWFDTIKYLIEHFNLTIEDIRSNNNESVQYACEKGYLHIVEYLVSFGLDANDIRSDDNWALASSSQNGHLNTVKYIVENFHFNVEDIRSRDNYAIYSARENGYDDVVVYLLNSIIKNQQMNLI